MFKNALFYIMDRINDASGKCIEKETVFFLYQTKPAAWFDLVGLVTSCNYNMFANTRIKGTIQFLLLLTSLLPLPHCQNSQINQSTECAVGHCTLLLRCFVAVY